MFSAREIASRSANKILDLFDLMGRATMIVPSYFEWTVLLAMRGAVCDMHRLQRYDVITTTKSSTIRYTWSSIGWGINDPNAVVGRVGDEYPTARILRH